jgi:hypothetical protein
MGVYAGKDLVAPCYLVGYEMTINYVKRLQNSMEIDKMLIPHFGVIKGTACMDFLANALASSELLRNIIIEDYLQKKTIEEIIENYKNIFYTNELQKIQPLRAFYINANYLVPMIIREVLR